ncbi:helix-turn-helix domain-containing protein [Acholeplasma sp. OttesenSCG-928-E16]|nr:helix-turn-helix domain-containing protein [Acholeplasma sp. OttesenSCG-928-E16]
MDEKRFKEVVAANIIKYRKQRKITQLELAEHLDYSDKAVSKWERGESLPDVIVLKEIADFFDVSLDTLITDEKEKKFKIGFFSIKKRVLVPILSVLIVWLVATLVYTFFIWLKPPFFSSVNGVPSYWLVFIYALPVSFIVLVVFSAIWWNHFATGVVVSLLLWSIALTLHLSLSTAGSLEVDKTWLVYTICVPLQIAAILWFFMRPQNIFKKSRKRKKKKS